MTGMVVETEEHIAPPAQKTSQFGSLIKRGAWGLGDQALISAANFLTTVVLARKLDPTDFGGFALLYGAVYFAISLQTTLVSRPHNVLGATRAGADYRQYTSVTAVSQVGLTAVFVLVTVVAATLAKASSWGLAPLVFALIPALAAWQLQEFTRRVLYTEGRLRAAFANDAVSYGGQAASILILGYFGSLTGVRAFWVIALTSALAAAVGCWQIRHALSRRGLWDALRARAFMENWQFGRWLFGAALATWVAGQLYPILIGGLINIAEAGAFAAVLTLMGPARILLIAMDTALAPVAARTYAEHGRAALHAFVIRLFTLTGPLIAAYTVLVSLFSRQILVAAYGERFRPYGWLLGLFAVSYAVDYLRHPISIALEARRASAPIFRAYLFSGIVVMTAGVAAVRLFGLLGAALGTITNSLILGVMLWHYYRDNWPAPATASAVSPRETINAGAAFGWPTDGYAWAMATRAAPTAGDARPRAVRPLRTRVYAPSQTAVRVRRVARAAAIPLWEYGFAILGIFLCLDAGVRTIRILTGTEGPIQAITNAEVDYSAGSPLTQVLLFGVYLVSLTLLAMDPTRQLKRVLRAKYIWLLPALAVVSVLWSGSPTISFRRAFALLGSSIFALYLATRFPRLDLIRVFLVVSVIATILTALTAVALPAYAVDDSGAWQGVFGQKNHLGRFMALSAVLWVLYAVSVRRHRIVACFAFVCVALVFLSKSATSLALLFALASVLVLVRLLRARRGLAIPMLTIALALVGSFAFVAIHNPGQITGLLGRDSSLTGRTQLWSLVWQLIRTRPLTGFGYGGFWLGFDGPSAPVWYATGWNPPSAHDGYLDLLLDLGIAGMAIFLPTMLVSIRYAFALARRGRSLETAFPLIFLVFYLLSNITESYLVAYNTESWVLFFAVTLQLHMWWHEEGRTRPRHASRVIARPTIATRSPALRPVTAQFPTERYTVQEGNAMSAQSAQVTVSAIMPTHNAMPHLKSAIDSVLAQTFTDWELVIVDDNSTDGTQALLDEYRDSRIRVIELGETHDIAAMRNIALTFATGKYIAMVESNTVSAPERFAKQAAYLEQHREIHGVASQVEYLLDGGTPRPPVHYPEDPAEIDRTFASGQMALPFATAMIRSWCFERFGSFQPDVSCADDLEWFLRVRKNCNFRVLPEVLCSFRQDIPRVTFRQWLVDAQYQRYAAYRAQRYAANTGNAALSFDRFARRWQTRLALSTSDAPRYMRVRMQSTIGGWRGK